MAWGTILVPQPTPDEFQKGAAPFGVFLHGLVVCIDAAVCDSKTAIDWVCPAAIDFYAESTKADFDPDAYEMIGQATSGELRSTSMAIVCSRDPRYTAIVWKLVGISNQQAIAAWEDAIRPRGPDERR